MNQQAVGGGISSRSRGPPLATLRARVHSLLNAAERNSWEVLKLLLQPGAKHSVRTSSGNTVLHIVAEHGDIRTMEILMETRLQGLKSDARNEGGETALDKLRQRIDGSNQLTEAFGALLLSLRDEQCGDYGEAVPGMSDGEESEQEFVDAVQLPFRCTEQELADSAGENETVTD